MHDRLVTSAHAKYALMGDGTGSAPPGPDRTVTPALPPGGGHLFSPAKQVSAWRPCRQSLASIALPDRRHVAEQALQQPDSSVLGQRLVPVAALGGLDARGASRGALTGRNCLDGCAQPVAGGGGGARGEARAPVVPVVDKDGEPAGCRVQLVGDGGDV